MAPSQRKITEEQLVNIVMAYVNDLLLAEGSTRFDVEGAGSICQHAYRVNSPSLAAAMNPDLDSWFKRQRSLLVSLKVTGAEFEHLIRDAGFVRSPRVKAPVEVVGGVDLTSLFTVFRPEPPAPRFHAGVTQHNFEPGDVVHYWNGQEWHVLQM